MESDFRIDDIILCCFVPVGTGAAVHKNRQSHGLAFKTNGENKYFFSSGKVLSFKKNDIIYLPKNSNYTLELSGAGDCYAINFNLFDDFIDEPFVFHTKDSARFVEYFKTAEKYWKNKKSGFSLKCKSELYDILYKMQSEHRYGYGVKSKFEIIKPAVEYIHEKYSIEPISIEFLSQMCGITPEYFRSIFKSNFGTSPIKYINEMKIARAKELLDSNMYSVTDAATLSGFNDISHFSRKFKRSCGQSPSEYAKVPR